MNKGIQDKYYQEMMLRARLTGVISGMIRYGEFTVSQKRAMAECLFNSYKEEGFIHDSALNSVRPEIKELLGLDF